MASVSTTYSPAPTRRLKPQSRENQKDSPFVQSLNGCSSFFPIFSIWKRRLNHDSISNGGQKKKRCACSPSTHPGSFRCSLHRPRAKIEAASPRRSSGSLKLRMLAVKNLLTKMGKDSEAIKINLKEPVRPIFQRRREAFVPRRSTLSRMSGADGS